MILADMPMKGRPFFCSWSGGKDSCLALRRAVQAGGKPRALLTMLSENGVTSRSHGLPRALIEAQAGRLRLRPVFRSASWAQYEAEFVAALHEFKRAGIEVGVFGDIDVESHREWVRRVCGIAGITPVHPLWMQDRRALLNEFVALGFTARIVVVNERKLAGPFLGEVIDPVTIARLEQAGIDPSGEMGEYHTVVVAGPLFSSAVEIRTVGEHHHEGYRFLQLEVSATAQTEAGVSCAGGRQDA